ncbi:MAG: hypothetical protein QME75_12465 [Deltaproteobacteria bacterium]|nr:hypothetical protein [Deltaproteobacteria bacterium]
MSNGDAYGQPMGNSGVQVDIETGRPVGLTAEDRDQEISKARERLLQAYLRSRHLREELARDQGFMLRALEAEMTARAEAVLAEDAHYQGLVRFAQTLGLQVKVIPQLVEREIKRQLGADLYNLTREPRTAPDRDTGR